MDNSLRVHGSIFFLLKKFIDHTQGPGSWNKYLSEHNLSDDFAITDNYPIEEIGAILQSASTHTGKSVHQLLEEFGIYMVPDLFHLYASYLQPEWKTFDVVMYTESVMHGAVRKLNSTAHPPILNVTRVSDKLLMVDYFSKRRLGALAVGIIKGIAIYFKEDKHIHVVSISSPDAERVQIKVEKI